MYLDTQFAQFIILLYFCTMGGEGKCIDPVWVGRVTTGDSM